MSKTLWWVLGIAGVAWLLSMDENSSSSFSPQGTASAPGRYGYAAADGNGGDAEAEDRAEEVRQAKQEFENAAGELRDAVRGLQDNRWDGQMSTIRSRLEDAEAALSELETLRPGDPAVLNARDEVDTMRSHLSRLQFENWRTVRPDLDSTTSAIEDEASAVSEDEDDD